MLVEFKVVDNEQAVREKFPDAELHCVRPRQTWVEGKWEWLGATETNYGWSIYRFVDGTPVEYIGSDGGEPEDQLLVRDLSWIAGALEAAYRRGLEASRLETPSMGRISGEVPAAESQS